MRYFFEQTSFTRTLFFVAGDIFLISCAVFLAFFLRFEGQIPEFYWNGTLQTAILLALACSIPLFFRFNLFTLSWRHVSTRDVLLLWRALTIGFLILGSLVILLKGLPVFAQLPRSVLVMSYLFSFLFIGALRLGKRIFLQMSDRGDSSEKTSVIIVGAGDAAEQLVRSMVQQKSSYLPLCFVDDSLQKQGMRIHGVKVAGKIADIPELVVKLGPKQLIIAMPSAPSSAIKQAVEFGRQAGIQSIKILPSLGEILDGKVSLAQVRDVQVQDLLGRELVSLDTEALSRFLKDKIVLVTGAAGSIGSELCRQVATFAPSTIVLFDQDESGVFMFAHELNNRFPKLKVISYVGDVIDGEKVREVFASVKPQIVFHAAAYKHVSLMEQDPVEAIKTNVFGTRTVSGAALGAGTECFVYVSTDKAVNPSSVMGATKRVGEMICQLANQKGQTRFISVRFGNVLDSRGNVIAIFREQIKRGGPLTITHPDMKRYFMTNPEACLLVMQASTMGKGGEVFVLDMGSLVKVVDLAKEMIRLSGLEPDKDIPIVFTGSRPGEKLFEEMLTSEEREGVTTHAKIFSARPLLPAPDLLEKSLKLFSETRDKKSVCKILEDLIPSYHSSL